MELGDTVSDVFSSRHITEDLCEGVLLISCIIIVISFNSVYCFTKSMHRVHWALSSSMSSLLRRCLLRPVYSDTTQLNWTQLDVQLSTRSQREQQLTQFVGRDVINKNTTDLAVHCSTGSVEFSW